MSRWQDLQSESMSPEARQATLDQGQALIERRKVSSRRELLQLWLGGLSLAGLVGWVFSLNSKPEPFVGLAEMSPDELQTDFQLLAELDVLDELEELESWTEDT